MDYINKSIKGNFKRAEKLNSIFAITIGEEEMKNNTVNIKNMLTKNEEKVPTMNIVEYLSDALENMNNEHECSCGCNDDECHCHEEK